jgi:hypothetical protein
LFFPLDRGLTPAANTNAAAARLLNSIFDGFVSPPKFITGCDTVSKTPFGDNKNKRPRREPEGSLYPSAEEVAGVYPELVACDKDGQLYTVRYQYLTTMLLNEAQKQYHRAESEAKLNAAQEEKIRELEQRLSRFGKTAGESCAGAE